MLDKKFTHLNIHSEYSIVDSIVKIDQLSEKAQHYNYESIAITDSANLFGFLNARDIRHGAHQDGKDWAPFGLLAASPASGLWLLSTRDLIN